MRFALMMLLLGTSSVSSFLGRRNPLPASRLGLLEATTKHWGYCCDICGMDPIVGPRFSAVNVDNVDICFICATAQDQSFSASGVAFPDIEWRVISTAEEGSAAAPTPAPASTPAAMYNQIKANQNSKRKVTVPAAPATPVAPVAGEELATRAARDQSSYGLGSWGKPSAKEEVAEAVPTQKAPAPQQLSDEPELIQATGSPEIYLDPSPTMLKKGGAKQGKTNFAEKPVGSLDDLYSSGGGAARRQAEAARRFLEEGREGLTPEEEELRLAYKHANMQQHLD